jgi:hypothetical protein
VFSHGSRLPCVGFSFLANRLRSPGFRPLVDGQPLPAYAYTITPSAMPKGSRFVISAGPLLAFEQHNPHYVGPWLDWALVPAGAKVTCGPSVPPKWADLATPGRRAAASCDGIGGTVVQAVTALALRRIVARSMPVTSAGTTWAAPSATLTDLPFTSLRGGAGYLRATSALRSALVLGRPGSSGP